MSLLLTRPRHASDSALALRRELMQIQVQTGQLSMETYLQQLRDAIRSEVLPLSPPLSLYPIPNTIP